MASKAITASRRLPSGRASDRASSAMKKRRSAPLLSHPDNVVAASARFLSRTLQTAAAGQRQRGQTLGSADYFGTISSSWDVHRTLAGDVRS